MKPTADYTGIKDRPGILNSGQLISAASQKFDLIEGIIFKGLVPEVRVTQEHLFNVHEELMNHYREQWEIKVSQPPITSQSYSFSQAEKFDLKYIYLKPYIKPQPPNSKVPNFDLSDQSLEALSCQNKPSSNLDWNTEEDISSIVFFPGTDPYKIAIYCYTKVDSTNQSFRETVNIGKIRSEETDILQWKSISNLFDGEIVTDNQSFPMVVSPKGQYVACIMRRSYKQFIKLYDREIQKRYELLTPASDDLYALAFHPKEDILVGVGKEQEIFLWDLITPDYTLYRNKKIDKLAYSVLDLNNWITTLAFNSKGTMLASGDRKGNIKLWDFYNRKEERSIDAHPDFKVNTLAFSPDDKFLVSGGSDGKIILRNIKTFDKKFLEKHLNSVNCITFSPDGNWLASCGNDNKVKVWDIKVNIWNTSDETSIKPKHIFDKHPSHVVTSVAFSPNSKILASGSLANRYKSGSRSENATIRLVRIQ